MLIVSIIFTLTERDSDTSETKCAQDGQEKQNKGALQEPTPKRCRRIENSIVQSHTADGPADVRCSGMCRGEGGR